MENEQATWPDELKSLFERVKSIPANDELELRVAVHDLQSFAIQSSNHYEQLDSAILESCSNLVRQASQSLSLSQSPHYLKNFHDKPYIRSINALIRTLLQKLEYPQHGLCLDGLQLQRCKLDHINLNHSSLRMTDLSHCGLSRASLSHVDLRFSNLMSSSMPHCNLSQSLLEYCEMDWCDLSRADLHRTLLVRADLGGSILDHTDLSSSILSGANLANATLTGANLSHANLFGSRLHATKLHGADLTGTGITPERLENVEMAFLSDHGTIWGSEDDCAGRNPLDPLYYSEQQPLL